jgi:hypothetical protein
LLRQTEVKQLRSASRQDDVPRLYVAMDDALPVCGVERVRHADGDSEGVGELQSARILLQTLRERLPFQMLEH